jgi:hypothetical protein
MSPLGVERQEYSARLTTLAGKLDDEIAWLEDVFGHGKKPRSAANIMALQIGKLTLQALRGADKLAGRKTLRGYGAANGPVMTFIRRRVEPLCERIGVRLADQDTLLRTLESDPQRRMPVISGLFARQR